MNDPNDHDEKSKPSPGFVMFMRSPFTIELLRDLLAFGLLALIAFRARWRSGFSVNGLEIGEALIGDYKNCGMTRREYRTRLARLVKWGFITAQPTPKGTIAKLASNAVFDINVPPPSERLTTKNRPSKRQTVSPLKTDAERPTERPTSGQQTANTRPLTNNDNKETKKKSDKQTLGNSTPSASSNGKGNQNFFVQGYQNQHQDQPAQDHVKWPEFSKWCRSKRDRRGQPGTPTENGFWKWLSGQKPHWRNKVRKDFDETGYVLNGQFLTDEEANRRGKENPELLTKFRRATKRDGKIQTLSANKFFLQTVLYVCT